MYISRVVIRNFRNFESIDVPVSSGVTCIVGENNTGKSNFLHAIRLALDINLPSYYRQLLEQDIHGSIDMSTPQQVIVSVEFSDFIDRENEAALVGAWATEVPDRARLTYRFRPKRAVREAIAADEHPGTGLTLGDYDWELTGGAAGGDPTAVEWNVDIGANIRMSDLQAFRVVFLQALRDVQQDLRSGRSSPLGRLLNASDIPEEEKAAIVSLLKATNDQIAGSQSFSDTGNAIQSSLAATAGDAYSLGVRLGMSDPSFTSIARSLTVLLSSEWMKDFEPERNGLGLNNVLYISILLEYFQRRIALQKTAGQLLLVEEPEAHLHPQLQRVLYSSLASESFQTIVTTHSSHITSLAPLPSIVVFTNSGMPATAVAVPGTTQLLTGPETSDLERYLDATRSVLFFARKVILVEGPAELFLVGKLIKHVKGIDLDRLGISVVPIFGVHFHSYARLFGPDGISKKCAILTDGDLKPSDATEVTGEDIALEETNLDDLENEFVQVFQCQTTFERALTLPGTLLMLSQACQECGATQIALALSRANEAYQARTLRNAALNQTIETLAGRVLNVAKRVGKGRFAQIASKHVNLATQIPSYLSDAVDWLVTDATDN